MKYLAGAIALSLVVACGASAAGAAAIVDQSNLPTNVRYLGSDEWQQQVTAGVGGQLDGVMLYGDDPSNLVRIALGDAFQSGPFVFSQTVHLIDGGFYIDTSAAHILLSAGQAFVIDVSGGSASCCTLRGSSANYAGGDMYDISPPFPPFDWTAELGGSLAFRTFMGPATASAAPEPSAWLLLTAGFGLIGAALRRRATVLVA
jgi:hypothetical protein